MIGVEHFLHRLAVHLDPADLAHRHRVLVSAPDALRRERVARDDRHHHRQAQARRAQVRLEHEREARAAGRGVGARAGERRALQHRQHRVLAFDVDDLGVERAVGDELRQVFDQRGLRRDRIDGDHLDARERDRPRGRLVAVADDELGAFGFEDRARRSSRAPPRSSRWRAAGIPSAQMPQPLQVA